MSELLSPNDLTDNRPGRELPATTSGSERRRRQPTAARSQARRADKNRNLPRQQPRIGRRRRGTNGDVGCLELYWQFEDEAPH